MSCDGNSQFGYVAIEDNQVVVYTGESNNPVVTKFCNDDLVQAMNIKTIIDKRIGEIKTILEEKEDIDWATDKSLGALDKALGIYESLLEESKNEN